MANIKLTKREKTKKIVQISLNVLTVLIVIFALVLVISSLTSSKRGYTSMFGNAYYVVQSDSMAAGQSDSFERGDIIYVKLLSDKEKKNLKVGDVITFWDTILGKKALNTHRITEIVTKSDGSIVFRTKGDANEFNDSTLRTLDDVQGIYKGKSAGFGKAIIWMQSKTGFAVCVITPSILILIYCIVLVIYNAVQYNKKKLVFAKEEAKDELDEDYRAKIRAELLEEMKKQQADAAKEGAPEDGDFGKSGE